MKNLLFLAVIAMLLFSLSAALSLWLNQARQTEPPASDKDKVLPKPSAPGGELKEAVEPKSSPKFPPITSGPDTSALIREQEAKLERKALQISLVLQDVQSQRDATDALLRQVSAELKSATTKSSEQDAIIADLQKKKTEINVGEKKNLEKLAAVYDAMTPEGAAPILKQMAESGAGKMEQAAQILVLMKERNAARILEAMGDPILAGQLMDKVRGLKALTSPPPAALPVRTP